MPNVYVVIGDANTKKSSIIRALSGVDRRDNYLIEDLEGNTLNIFIQIRSLQESKISIQEFIDYITKQNIENVLVALRKDRCNSLPQGMDYLQSFVANSWSIQQIVVLGENQLPNLPQGCPQPNFFPNSADENIAANNIAHEIRKIWNWK